MVTTREKTRWNFTLIYTLIWKFKIIINQPNSFFLRFHNFRKKKIAVFKKLDSLSPITICNIRLLLFFFFLSARLLCIFSLKFKLIVTSFISMQGTHISKGLYLFLFICLLVWTFYARKTKGVLIPTQQPTPM